MPLCVCERSRRDGECATLHGTGRNWGICVVVTMTTREFVIYSGKALRGLNSWCWVSTTRPPTQTHTYVHMQHTMVLIWDAAQVCIQFDIWFVTWVVVWAWMGCDDVVFWGIVCMSFVPLTKAIEMFNQSDCYCKKPSNTHLLIWLCIQLLTFHTFTLLLTHNQSQASKSSLLALKTLPPPKFLFPKAVRSLQAEACWWLRFTLPSAYRHDACRN